MKFAPVPQLNLIPVFMLFLLTFAISFKMSNYFIVNSFQCQKVAAFQQ